MKTVCATGHRPNKLPWEINDDLKAKKEFIERLKEYVMFCVNDGFSDFISGGALGVDLDFAETVISLKQSGLNLRLEMAIPCCGQEKYWTAKEKARYINVLKQADKVTVLFPHYTPFCMQSRNRYMVDKSDAVICCWNGDRKGGTFSTVKYAQSKHKKLLFLNLKPNALNGGNSMIYFIEKLV